MHNRWGWGLVWLLGSTVLSACGDDASSNPNVPYAGGEAGASGNAGSSGSAGAGASASGSGGAGAVVPAQGCPLTAPTRAELGSKLEPIAGAVGVSSVHMTAKGLFWTTYEWIYRLQSDGTGVQFAQTRSADLLTSNATQLAWHGASNGMEGIWRAPLDGSVPAALSLVTAANSFIEVLALDDTHAYFDRDGLQRAPLEGGAMAVQLANAFGFSALAIDEGFAYYVESLGENVLRVAVTGGTPETVSPKIGMITAIAVDPGAIYAARLSSINRLERSEPPASKVILRLAQATGSLDNQLSRLIDDGERLVFADRLDNIGWVTKDGTRCGYVVTEGKTSVGAVSRSEIALDAQYLYLTDSPTRTLSRIKRSDIGLLP